MISPAFIVDICFIFCLYFQSVTQEEVTQEELGGAKTHNAVSGKYVLKGR